MSGEVAVLTAPDSEFAGHMFACAAKLRVSQVDFGVRSFCFTADQSGIGTTVVAANIAAAFASMGLRTILIETNFRRPRLARLFDLPGDRRGLFERLVSDDVHHSWSHFLNPVHPNLFVVETGHAPVRTPGSLGSLLPEIVMHLSRAFDLVICDAPAIDDAASVLPILSSTECAVAVARRHVTRVSNLTAFEKVAAAAGVRIGGVVYLQGR